MSKKNEGIKPSTVKTKSLVENLPFSYKCIDLQAFTHVVDVIVPSFERARLRASGLTANQIHIYQTLVALGARSGLVFNSLKEIAESTGNPSLSKSTLLSHIRVLEAYGLIESLVMTDERIQASTELFKQKGGLTRALVEFPLSYLHHRQYVRPKVRRIVQGVVKFQKINHYAYVK